ncbi:tetraspanin-33-like [Ostrea edulis]|uniref:tetraspanin-33-like n=1 Tax=Ostrea edulis TaxID=37623 RepID=UPI0020963904|nr:tetraspanin-33-like [Ostrea edulis]
MAPPPGRIHRDRSAVNPCLKYFIFLFNFVFMIISLITIVLTSWIIHEKDKTIDSFIDVLLDPSLMLLIVSCIALFITYMGALGALRENETMLVIYSHIVTFFIFIQVVGVVFLFLFYYDNSVLVTLNIYPEELFKDAIIKYREDADQQDFIDYWQKQMDCCGFSDDDEGYKAWNANMYFNCTEENTSAESCAVPWSCCVLNDGDKLNLLCGNGALKAMTSSSLKDQIYTRGCLKAVRVWVGSNVFVFGCVVIAVLVPQVLAICFARNLNDQILIQKSKWLHG